MIMIELNASQPGGGSRRRAVLVTAASRHGATAEIAEAIGKTLTEHGLAATVAPPGDVGTIDSYCYDAVIIGSAVYTGHWLDAAKDLVHRHRSSLATRPVWLYSSGPVGDPSGKLVGVSGGQGQDASGLTMHRALRNEQARVLAPPRSDLSGQPGSRDRVHWSDGQHPVVVALELRRLRVRPYIQGREPGAAQVGFSEPEFQRWRGIVAAVGADDDLTEGRGNVRRHQDHRASGLVGEAQRDRAEPLPGQAPGSARSEGERRRPGRDGGEHLVGVAVDRDRVHFNAGRRQGRPVRGPGENGSGVMRQLMVERARQFMP
jgi:hypothetical protein